LTEPSQPPHTGADRRFLRREEAAEIFDVSERTIRRWAAAGLLEERHIGPRMVRVTAESVERLARGDVPSDPPAAT
jgi:predicted site-specific integrase-resolvase